MQNQKPALNDIDRRFLDDVATLLEPWGMSHRYGRMYAYLLLRTEPVTIEQIAADLQLSKSGAWDAARELGDFGHIRRQTDVGSKRALFSQSDNYGAPLQKETVTLGAMARLLRGRAAQMAPSDVRERLLRRAGFYESICGIIDRSIEELHAQQVI